MKMIGLKDHPRIQTLYEQCTLNEAEMSLSDVLYHSYELLPSGKRNSPLWNRFKIYFVPLCIRLLNMSLFICMCMVCMDILF